jgi:hypothetical protein
MKHYTKATYLSLYFIVMDLLLENTHLPIITFVTNIK